MTRKRRGRPPGPFPGGAYLPPDEKTQAISACIPARLTERLRSEPGGVSAAVRAIVERHYNAIDIARLS